LLGATTSMRNQTGKRPGKTSAKSNGPSGARSNTSVGAGSSIGSKSGGASVSGSAGSGVSIGTGASGTTGSGVSSSGNLASSGPYDAFNFTVEISGVSAALFTECVLPVATIEVIEYRAGADLMSNIHKLPGLVKYGNLVLKRGLTNSMALWDWFSAFASGTGTTAMVTVTLHDSAKTPVITWRFMNAWPLKYESPVLNGKVSALAIETLELAVDGMKVASTGAQTT